MVIEIDKPNPKQDIFLRDTHRHVGFGGARGGGKSWAIRVKAVLLCMKHSGITVMIVRKTYPELIANHIKPLKELLQIGVRGTPCKYNDSRKEIVFDNGSQILFRYCDSERDLDRYQGTETDVLFIDEATQMPEEWIKKIVACVRGVNAFPKRIYYTCNPGGKGHGYIKRIFIDRQYLSSEHAEDYSFTQSLVQDNKALMESDPDYLKNLEALPDTLRAAWLEGRWDVFEGMVFGEWRNDPSHYWDRRWTHVIDNLETIPPDWKIYRGFDFGYSRPSAVGWFGLDHAGRLYLFRELYTGDNNIGQKLTVQEIAERIRDIEDSDPRLKGRKIFGIADPAIWEKSHGESIAEMMEKSRIYWEKGDHARLAGKMQFHFRLAFNADGIPMFYCCKECKHFIRTIPLLIYDDKNVEDIDTDQEDHHYDEARYVFMAHPLNPRKNIKKPIEDRDDPLEMIKENVNGRY